MPQFTESEVRDQLRTLIADRLKLDESEIEPTAHLKDDLGADSLDQVDITMCVEELYDVMITDEEAEKATNLDEITELVLEKVNHAD